MKTFRQFVEQRIIAEADPLGGPMGGGIASPGALPPGGPPGMGGGPPMPPPPGGIGGMGGMGGMSPPMGDPMMGGGGGTQQKPLHLEPLDVWQVLERILSGKEVEDKKEKKPERSQSPQPQHLQM